MAEEVKKILTIETGRSFDNIRQLRSEIRQLNQVVETGTKLVADENGELQEVAVTSEEYDKAVKQLAEDKRTLADVTNLNRNAWNSEADSVDRSAKSYQQLQAEMRRLRVAWRDTTSANDRKVLAAEINDINNRLKEMDAETGFFQRNVGDYFNSIQKGLAGLPSFLGHVKKGVNDVSASMKLLSGNPLIGVLTLLFPLIQKITGELKEDTTVINALKKATDALEPVFNAVTKVVETLAGWISKAVDWFVKLFEGSKDTFASIVSGAVGVGNAILQYLLTPIRTVVEAAKGLGNIFKDIFTGNWKQIKEDAEAAFGGIKDAFTKGFDFSGNFDLGKEAGQKFIDGLFASSEKAKDAGAAAAQAFAEGFDDLDVDLTAIDKIDEKLDLSTKNWEKWAKDMSTLAERAAARQKLEAEMSIEDEATRAQMIADIDAELLRKKLDYINQAIEAEGDPSRLAELYEARKDAVLAIDKQQYDQEAAIRKKDEEAEKKHAENKKNLYSAVGSTIKGVLNGIADVIENSADADEKSAKQVKALRIASAIIDTISAAVSSYNAMSGIPYVGPALGAAAAASATAMGIANIAKIRSTNVSKNDSSGGGSSGNSTPTITTPPAVLQEVPVTRTLTGASEAQAVNQAPAETKVVLVMSELEAKQGEIAAKQVETTF